MGNKKIKEPEVYTIVRHTGWMTESDNYPCDVLITNGQYYSNGRLSNFWTWRRILPDGTLSEEECGYGDFEKSSKKYKIEIRVSVIK